MPRTITLKVHVALNLSETRTYSDDHWYVQRFTYGIEFRSKTGVEVDLYPWTSVYTLTERAR